MTIDWLIPDTKGAVQWPALPDGKKGVLTIGAFDGMHRGHQAVLERAVEKAHELGAISVAILLDPRPAAAHAYAQQHDGADTPDDFHDPDALMPVDRRLELIERTGIDRVFVVRYTMAFAAVSYISFLGQMVGKVGMRTLVLGSDARMGAKQAGDLKAIRNLALATGVFELDVVDNAGPGATRLPFQWTPQTPTEAGEPHDPLEGMNKAERRTWSKRHHAREARVWSSSNVRYLLGNGRVHDAAEVLGRPHAVEGTVVHGEQRGRTLGFPTANLGNPVDGYVPVDGVYAGWLVDFGEAGHAEAGAGAGAGAGADGAGAAAAHADGVTPRQEIRRWPAAISIGTKETFDRDGAPADRVVEAYACTDEELDLYGHRMRVEFCGFLRPQQRFDSAAALAAQLATDARSAAALADGQESAE